MEKTLSVCMATYDDYDGVFFTIQALRMYHDICRTDKVEFIVLDSNPSSKRGKATKEFVTKSIKEQGRYIINSGETSSFNKYKTISYAQGKYIIILDCHVLLEQGSVDALLEYFRQRPNCKDLVQGPLLYNNLQGYSTHFKQGWGSDMYGQWSTNKEAYEKGLPFEIEMNGMGLCAFERKNWPGIMPFFKGFGAEEGYIAARFRKNGGKNICLPQLGWNHRFGRPDGVKYPLIIEHRIWNYFVGWLDITDDPNHEMIKEIYDYFKNRISEKKVAKLLTDAWNTVSEHKQKLNNKS